MDITFKTRPFYPDEVHFLNALKTKKVKQSSSKVKFYHFVIAGLLGTLCTYIAVTIPDSFWTFLFGAIAVFTFGFIVFTPYEIYKLKRRHRNFLQQLNGFIAKGAVDTCHIKTERIAVAPEYEDESDLYIIELSKTEVLYLWNLDYNLNKKFPCFDFEIYAENFSKLLGRQIYSHSDRIKPITIDKKAKWNYIRKIGAPGHLQIETKNFGELINDYNNCA